ncbi:DUF4395 domain-containing protein [Rhodococcus sp. CH91]|uniref:DUF4395 domain-containing protein n=1 Tax=Rhodococcus sp. CH91 TaxID=2910256 RepID=UPI001F4BB877|nr:DUF4395 domain-containing protein [Rhodococcus sp. CH91]
MSVSTRDTVGPQVDVRGPRFAAWITTGILVAVLILTAFSPVAAAALLALQTIVFALGALLGPRRSPYGTLFAQFVAPRLGAPAETEPVAPLRFAQLVGFVFALVGTASFFAGSTVVGSVATGFALFAALMNAAFGVCLGCRLYPLVARMRRATA